MAGLYIHIPLCTQRCTYCDFFSTTLLSHTDRLIDALCLEMQSQTAALPQSDSTIRTIYIGGGTPSLLAPHHIERLLTTALTAYTHIPAHEMEITIECNPDDLTPQYLNELRHTPINRLSIGIQSFIDSELSAIHRRHDAHQAIAAYYAARQAGYSNVSIDLIFGLPHQDMETWRHSLTQALALRPDHISAYCLELHDGSLLTRKIRQGAISVPGEQTTTQMYDTLRHTLAQAGYHRYEVSNFALPGREAKHNSAYWTDTPYIGIGPAAHSYDGQRRWSNVAHLPRYISSTLAGHTARQYDDSTPLARLNDYIITSLRTSQGIDIQHIEQHYSREHALSFEQNAIPLLHRGQLLQTERGYRFSDDTLLAADYYLVDLMIDPDEN